MQMSLFPWMLAVFLGVPIFEVYLLIQVGGLIGVWKTVALVVFTAVLGAGLMRAQGLATLNAAREKMERGELPAMALAEGILILIAGALLLTPGFATDAVGFFLLLPPSRQWLVGAVLLPRFTVHMQTHRHAEQDPSRPNRIYNGQFEQTDDR